MKGGRTEREEALETEIAELRAEVSELKARERLYLDRFDEQGRHFRALIEALRMSDADLHIDLDSLAAAFGQVEPVHGGAAAASAAA